MDGYRSIALNGDNYSEYIVFPDVFNVNMYVTPNQRETMRSFFFSLHDNTITIRLRRTALAHTVIDCDN